MVLSCSMVFFLAPDVLMYVRHCVLKTSPCRLSLQHVFFGHRFILLYHNNIRNFSVRLRQLISKVFNKQG